MANAAQALAQALQQDGEIYVETSKLQDVSVAELSRAIARGTVIYENADKRVAVVRFALPRSGGELHVAKATWLADGDSRAEALGALVCAEVRAYKLLQSGGVAHPNVGALDAAAWAASGGAAAAQASPAPMGDAGGPNIASPRHLDGGGSCSSGSYVVLIQRYYGGQTLDSYVAARIAAAPKRMAPGALEFERILLPLVEGVAGAIAHAHGMGLTLRDFKPGNVLISDRPACADGSCAAAASSPAAVPVTGAPCAGAPGAARRGRGGLPAVPILIDFDGAVPTGEEAATAAAGEFAYTPPYVAPELARAALAAAAAAGRPPRVTGAAMARHAPKGDVFAFGIAVWQLAHAGAAGVPYPFARGDPTFSNEAAWLEAIAEDALPANPLLSPPLLRLINQCLEKDPSLRPDMAAAAQLVGEWRLLLDAAPAAEGGRPAAAAAAWAGDAVVQQQQQQQEQQQQQQQPPQQRLRSAERGDAQVVVVTWEQLAADRWHFIGPCGSRRGPASRAALLSGLKAGRLSGVTPVIVWPSAKAGRATNGRSDVAGALVPLAALAPLLAESLAARGRGRWGARPAGSCGSCGLCAGCRGCGAAPRLGAAERLAGREAVHPYSSAPHTKLGHYVGGGSGAGGAPRAELLRRKAQQWRRRAGAWCHAARAAPGKLGHLMGGAALRAAGAGRIKACWKGPGELSHHQDAARPLVLAEAGSSCSSAGSGGGSSRTSPEPCAGLGAGTGDGLEGGSGSWGSEGSSAGGGGCDAAPAKAARAWV
ncbi:hypothetical protein MNEG_1926 [Monoraphidium neglectum]|uniref:Protein kinase domain-containing protein n=1 Tax=Monoraphidium neglectum TaxID=145388 RepID=A0A0D2N0F2_9CHLO|nr:hypothetical protein MNEG_1926 [Monoraphidium neglectum]KIZ06032.1 hypothetical protein MNEG_1926 [Monoraphidium neglectum]|eukprot:XP_013905051.1 hypothetical protein MNEG_1926 [Monoraphidium neglectum]